MSETAKSRAEFEGDWKWRSLMTNPTARERAEALCSDKTSIEFVTREIAAAEREARNATIDRVVEILGRDWIAASILNDIRALKSAPSPAIDPEPSAADRLSQVERDMTATLTRLAVVEAKCGAHESSVNRARERAENLAALGQRDAERITAIESALRGLGGGLK